MFLNHATLYFERSLQGKWLWIMLKKITFKITMGLAHDLFIFNTHQVGVNQWRPSSALVSYSLATPANAHQLKSHVHHHIVDTLLP